MIAQKLSNVLRVFQLFGMFPTSFDKKSKNLFLNWKSTIFVIIRFIIILTLIVHQFFVLVKSPKRNIKLTFMETFLFVCKFMTERVVTIVFIFEILLKRKIIIEYFDQLNVFDKFIARNFNCKILQRKEKKHLLQMFFILTFSCVMILYKNIQSGINLVGNYMDFLTLLQYFQAIVFIGLIEDRIQMINECLMRFEKFESKKMIQISIIKQIDFPKKNPNKMIIDLRECFSMIWRATQSLNYLFHYTLPALITFSFVQVLVGIYIIFISIMYNRDDIDIYYSSIISAVGLLMIFFLTSASTNVIELVRTLFHPFIIDFFVFQRRECLCSCFMDPSTKVKYTIVLAHRIPIFDIGSENMEIKLLVIQIQHQKIHFSGAEFFMIDRSLCYEVSFLLIN